MRPRERTASFSPSPRDGKTPDFVSPVVTFFFPSKDRGDTSEIAAILSFPCIVRLQHPIALQNTFLLKFGEGGPVFFPLLTSRSWPSPPLDLPPPLSNEELVRIQLFFPFSFPPSPGPAKTGSRNPVSISTLVLFSHLAVCTEKTQTGPVNDG